MSDTVLHLLAGPNGAGKSTLYSTIIGQATQLEFVNADLISAQLWPDDPVDKSYEAAVIAAERRSEMIEHKVSFVTGTVFSHESKLQLVNAAMSAGYLVTLHVVLIPKALAPYSAHADRSGSGAWPVSVRPGRRLVRRVLRVR